MSTINENHKVCVYEIKDLQKHPNADKLSLAQVDNYTVVVKTEDWINRKFGVFIPPDSVVPAKAEYAFLASDGQLSTLESTHRYRVIRAKRLRGIVSYGLLMPVPADITNPYVGMDLSAHMGITHWNPTPNEEEVVEKEVKTDQKKSKILPKLSNYPNHKFSHKTYDLINHRKIANKLPKFDYITVSEKIHGSFCCYTYSTPVRKYRNNTCAKISKFFFTIKDKFFPVKRTMMMKSKNYWKEFTKPIHIKSLDKTVIPKKNNWELALEHNSDIEELCKLLPDHLIYGEIFGPVQKNYTYGHLLNNQPGPLYNKVQFKIFEIISPEGEILDGPKLYNLLTELDCEYKLFSNKKNNFVDLCVPLVIYSSKELPTIEELDALANDQSYVIINKKSEKEYVFPDHRKEGLVISFYNEHDNLIFKTKFIGSKYLLDEYKL